MDTEIDQTIPADKTFQFFTSSQNTSFNGGSSNEPVVMNESESKPLYLQIFSAPIALLTWVFSFRWYVTLIIIILFFYLVFQMQYAFEERRNKHKLKKEGMNANTDEDESNDQNTKHVTFALNQEDTSSNADEISKSDEPITKSIIKKTNNGNIFADTYNNWITPWIYTVFRNIGISSK